MQTQVRKRVGFKADTDGPPNDGDRILDEQGTAACIAPLKFTTDLALWWFRTGSSY